MFKFLEKNTTQSSLDKMDYIPNSISNDTHTQKRKFFTGDGELTTKKNLSKQYTLFFL